MSEIRGKLFFWHVDGRRSRSYQQKQYFRGRIACPDFLFNSLELPLGGELVFFRENWRADPFYQTDFVYDLARRLWVIHVAIAHSIPKASEFVQMRRFFSGFFGRLPRVGYA
jgi:hypothetical protein